MLTTLNLQLGWVEFVIDHSEFREWVGEVVLCRIDPVVVLRLVEVLVHHDATGQSRVLEALFTLGEGGGPNKFL